MPLMWAHAEYIKLLRSLRDRRVFDMPPQTVQRYLLEKHPVEYTVWRFNQKCSSVPAGFILRIELLTPATVMWTTNGGSSQQQEQTIAGVHFLDIRTNGMAAGTELEFTFRWENGQWEGHNFDLKVV